MCVDVLCGGNYINPGGLSDMFGSWDLQDVPHTERKKYSLNCQSDSNQLKSPAECCGILEYYNQPKRIQKA